MLYFCNVYQWDFGIFIFFNTTTVLALQMSRICLPNLYLILKSLVFAGTSQLYEDRYLPQYCYSLLLPGLSYFPNGLLPPSNSFHILLKVSEHGVNALLSLKSWISAMMSYLNNFHLNNLPLKDLLNRLWTWEQCGISHLLVLLNLKILDRSYY